MLRRRMVATYLAEIYVSLVVYATIRASQTGIDLQHGSVSSQIGGLLAFSGISALFAYATVESVKRLTPARGIFNAIVLEDWYGAASGTGRDPEVVAELMSVLAPEFRGSRRRTLDLPADQLVARVSAAVELASMSPSSRIPHMASEPPRYAAPFLALRARSESPGAATQALRLALDDLQSDLSRGWRRLIQATVFCVASVYGLLLSFAGGVDHANQARYLFAGLILGGPFAWFIRDVTAAVEGSRRRLSE